MNRHLIRLQPIQPVPNLQQTVERFFNEGWNAANRTNANLTYRTPIDVIEYDHGYVITAELPGVSEDEIVIRLEDDVLTIEAERQSNTDDADNRNVLLNERRNGKFSRQIRLPRTVNGINVTASYVDGLLTVELPKLPEAQPRTIAVKTRDVSNN